MFIPDEKFIVYKADHWLVNHRVDAKLAGYLMVAPRDPSIRTISELPPEALSEMGRVIADTVHILKESFSPEHIYINRYGHTANCGWHFHVIPVYGWVKELYRNDPRYRVLNGFYANPNSEEEPDGLDYSLFIAREFCESPRPPKNLGPSVEETIEILRRKFKRG